MAKQKPKNQKSKDHSKIEHIFLLEAMYAKLEEAKQRFMKGTWTQQEERALWEEYLRLQNRFKKLYLK